MRPNLIHPILVTFERFETAGTVYDQYTRQPVKQAKRTTQYQLPAQVEWGIHDEGTATRLGLQDGEMGYLLFRKVDADRLGYTPVRRDRIVKIGTIEGLKLYIESVVPHGHYPDQGGHSLWRCNFIDRAPADQN